MHHLSTENEQLATAEREATATWHGPARGPAPRVRRRPAWAPSGSPRARMQAVLVAWAFAALAMAALPLGWYLRERAIDDVRHEARMQLDMALAVRSFVNDHVSKPMLDQADAFHVGAVPSFAATTAMASLQQRYPDVRYREVSFNPTNAANLARGVDAEMLTILRKTDARQVERVVDEGGHAELRLALPLRVTGPACLQCHGTPRQAPPGLVASYGSAGGFGWQVGDTIGAQVVAVPMAAPFARAWQSMLQFLAGGAVVVGATIFGLDVILRRMVVDPMAREHSTLARLATEDGLTGTLNRRSFVQAGEHALAQAGQAGEAVAVVMMDIDHFKRVNDRWGHAAGDAVLREFAARARRRLRQCDLLGRLGGEEFALLLPGADADGAARAAEEILGRLHEQPFAGVGTVTASFGVAAARAHESIDDVLARADGALYAAKHGGRARVARAAD